jgi:hypothetical protein
MTIGTIATRLTRTDSTRQGVSMSISRNGNESVRKKKRLNTDASVHSMNKSGNGLNKKNMKLSDDGLEQQLAVMTQERDNAIYSNNKTTTIG